jgi:hypothetical protein
MTSTSRTPISAAKFASFTDSGLPLGARPRAMKNAARPFIYNSQEAIQSAPWYVCLCAGHAENDAVRLHAAQLPFPTVAASA